MDARGTTANVAMGGGVERGQTKTERENARLKEQLKFQGAVLDQLAGDVHNLERKAV
ncbi:unnamed protein product, partial [Laminaria digitata]